MKTPVRGYIVLVMLLLCFSLLSVNAFAEEKSIDGELVDITQTPEPEIFDVLGNIPSEKPVAETELIAAASSGRCGSALSWTLNDIGTLEITGKGTMDEFPSSSKVPWYSKCSSIKMVKISSGVTTIGKYAFYNCTSLSSIVIPDSVTSIGYCAFDNCTSLTSVTIPNSVTLVSDWAFYKCSSMTDVTIGNNVTTIGECAFGYCTKLRSITIPDSVTTIGNHAFVHCGLMDSVTIPSRVTAIGELPFVGCNSLSAINVSKDNMNYSSKDGVLFDINMRTLLQYPCGKTDRMYSIPSGTAIIAYRAFDYCAKLTGLIIPSSVTTINENFLACGLTDVYYTGTEAQWRRILFVNITFEYITIHCNYIPAVVNNGVCGENLTWALYDNGTLEICGTGAMTDYSSSFNAPWYSKRDSIKTVKINSDVTEIGNCAFLWCFHMAEITIPDSIIAIGNAAFAECTKLTDVYYTSSEAEWKRISIETGNEPLTKADIHFERADTLTLPAALTKIEAEAFEGVTAEVIVVPASVTEIGPRAFANCKNLRQVIFRVDPENVKIAEDWLDGCGEVEIIRP